MSPTQAETRTRRLVEVSTPIDHGVHDAADHLLEHQQLAVDRLGDFADDLERIAEGLAPGVLARRGPALRAPLVLAPVDGGGSSPGSHPAVLDAESLIRDAQRAMRRRAVTGVRERSSTRVESQLAFITTLALFIGLGWFAARWGGELPGDAVARVQAAQAVIAGRDPHLEAIGFIWGPFPTLFQVPLAALRAWWPALTGDAMAAVVVSSVFMAGVVTQLLRWGVESSARATMRLAVATVTVAHPLLWIFGANGMSEACWLFFCVVAARRLARWAETDELADLAVAGVAVAAAYLARYESLAMLIVGAAFVGVVAFRRWHPRFDDPAFGDPVWDHERDRLQRTALDVTLFAVPGLATVALWALASWAIVGEPFPQLTSEYGNAAIVAAAGDMEGIVPDTTSLGRVWFFLVQLGAAAPALVALVAVAVASSRTSTVRIGAAIAIFGSPLLAQVALSFRGSTFPWFRYSIGAVVLAALVVLTLASAGRVLRTAAVLALVPGVVISTAVFLDGRLGVADDALMVDAMAAAIDGEHPRAESLLGASAEIAAAVETRTGGVAGSVLCDAASCFSVLIHASSPQSWIIPSDRDYERLLAHPARFGVRYLLLGNPEATSTDSVHREHPRMWEEGGAPIGRQVAEWGNEQRPGTHFRLYEVEDPRGEPPARPTEEDLR